MPEYKTLYYHVDYDEMKPETYRGVYALSDIAEEVERVPTSGDMEKDYTELGRRCTGRAESYRETNSVHNFRIDRDTPPNLRSSNLKRRL